MIKMIHKKNGEFLIHYEGAFNDSALCGHDLSGDDIQGDHWSHAVPTNKRVNCDQCLQVVRHVRGTKP